MKCLKVEVKQGFFHLKTYFQWNQWKKSSHAKTRLYSLSHSIIRSYTPSRYHPLSHINAHQKIPLSYYSRQQFPSHCITHPHTSPAHTFAIHHTPTHAITLHHPQSHVITRTEEKAALPKCVRGAIVLRRHVLCPSDFALIFCEPLQGKLDSASFVFVLYARNSFLIFFNQLVGMEIIQNLFQTDLLIWIK